VRFSEAFGVERTADDDWFDPVLSEDTPLYVDPFLVFEDDSELWRDSHDLVVTFFDAALTLVLQGGGRTAGAPGAKALRLLTFPEPKEFALGLAMGSPVGSGTSSHFARQMADALEVIARAVHRKVDYIDLVALFVPGLGVDRISDIFCNILKSRFITYTQDVCVRYDVAVEQLTVRHARWDPSGRWVDARLRLPRSPVTGRAVLLTPDRFLQDIPQKVTAQGLWSWAETNVNEILRHELNYDLAQALTAAQKAQGGRDLARRRPDVAFRYVDVVAAGDHEPYDVRSDPDLRVRWFETGRAAAHKLLDEEGRRTPAPRDEDGFCQWVDTLIGELRHAIEDTDLWRALWDDELRKPRIERIVQAVAGAVLAPYCRAANVDISREANIGRGPVDFKFAAGWRRRALLEVKLMSSRKLQQGAAAQLPQYLRSERITCGYYVCVGFTDGDLSDERKNLVQETCRALSHTAGWAIIPRYIDARPQESASKL
jgi:hypothetical protein